MSDFIADQLRKRTTTKQRIAQLKSQIKDIDGKKIDKKVVSIKNNIGVKLPTPPPILPRKKRK